VQREACILGMPCVTLRDNTERPETIEVGANVLAGADGHQMMKKAMLMMQQGGGWRSPFWDDGQQRA
jgi:UDP-N-acetylglucosamine 2-epimerase (non-hydrolysing)